jgi:hypothetical protein
MRVNISIITTLATVAMLFGTTTTTLNIAWGAPQVKIDSHSCGKSGDNITFSWSGYPPDDDLELNLYGNKAFPLVSQQERGTSNGSGSDNVLLADPGNAEKYQLELNSFGADASAYFDQPCVP